MRSSLPCGLSRLISVLVLLLVGLAFSVAQEQPETAAIHGKVTDRTGAAVRDGKAVLASAAGARLAIPVNDKGVYSVTGLLPGTYTLTVSAASFADRVFANFTLTPGKMLTLDATLEPASAKPAVEAEGGGRWSKVPLPAPGKLQRVARAPLTGRRPTQPRPSWQMQKRSFRMRRGET